MMLSSAKVDALVHAAQHDCEPAIPLVQPETITPLKPPGVLMVDCPAGCGATFPVPIEMTDTLSVDAGEGELCVRFTAQAPELHDLIYRHLQTCPRARWLDTSMAPAPAAGQATARRR